MLEPLGREALARAAVAEGERVVDVGCGCGATTLDLARAVGSRGAVIGVDVSAPMLARARERARGLDQARFELGDAATLTLDAPADALFSRFGVMFFADPPRAFENLANMLRPGGRITFVCWRAVADNPWARLPFEAALQVLDAPAPPLDASGPGPFAFADAAHVRAILASAHFDAVRIDPFDAELAFGDTLDEAVAFALATGPAARLLGDAGEPVVARAREAIERVLTPFASGAPVRLPAATWIVSARREP
jgi:SAM-dependent methyltransferase